MLLPSQPGDEPLPHDVLVEKSEGYSGSDIRILCKEAAMQPLRRTLAVLEDTEDIVPEDGKKKSIYWNCLHLKTAESLTC